MIRKASWLAAACLAAGLAPARAQDVRLYGSAEYLLWWVKGAPLSVPLVSTGPESNFNGDILNSNTTILYGAPLAPAVGGKSVQDFSPLSGGRLTLGYSIDRSRGIGIEASGFGLQGAEAGYSNGGTPSASAGGGIRVPLYNAVPYFINVPIDAVPSENGIPVALPGRIGGQVTVSNKLSLWGLDLAGTYDLARGPNWSLTGLAGLRYLDLAEDFSLTDFFYGTGGVFLGQSGTVTDHFATRNRFIGPMLGVRGQAAWGPFSITAQARLGFGDTIQDLNVTGAFRAMNYTPTSGAQGIFAQPANSGHRSSDHFAVEPEFQVKLGYDLTPNIRLTLGYDILYLSNVIRPTDQIDRNLPKGQIFGQGGSAISTTYPAKLFRTTDFYAQGLNAGVSFRF
jgi:hypothetical protein